MPPMFTESSDTFVVQASRLHIIDCGIVQPRRPHHKNANRLTAVPIVIPSFLCHPERAPLSSVIPSEFYESRDPPTSETLSGEVGGSFDSALEGPRSG